MAAVACMLICLLQRRFESKLEMLAGSLVSLLFSLIPQLLFFVWFVPVILVWIRESIFVWRKSYPAFRIGAWIGLGAVSYTHLTLPTKRIV